MMPITMTIEMFDDDGEATEHTVGAKWEICIACEGEGREWFAPHPDDFERAPYSERCDCCAGTGKVKVIAARTPEEVALVKSWERQERKRAAEREADARTYRMECGIWD